MFGKATRLADIVEISNIAQYKIKVEVNPLYVRENEISTLRGSNAKLIEVVGELNNISIDDTLRWMYTKGLKRCEIGVDARLLCYPKTGIVDILTS